MSRSGFSFHGSCHVGGHLTNNPNHRYGNHNEKFLKNHEDVFKINHQGRSHISNHQGRSNASNHIALNGASLNPHHKLHYAGSLRGNHHHGSSHKVHQGDHQKALSVHGGSGGKGTFILNKNLGVSHSKNHNLFTLNEKETMRHLNDRLASFLDKVRSLEQQNAQLERSILEWYERNQPSILPDFSCFFRNIQELQGQISSTSRENARNMLQIDNARLAADDYQNKYEMERQLRCSIEADVNGLRLLLEELNREMCQLRTQVQNLQEELQMMKRSHAETIFVFTFTGDIQELYNTKLSSGHVAAFSEDCDLPSLQEIAMKTGIQNSYMGFLDYRKKTVQKLGISPSTCSFNPGVFVANMTEWRQQHITKKLEKWMKKNVEENLYSSNVGGGVATPPMLIVFHGIYTPIPPNWHIRHLGWSPDDHIAPSTLKDAKLLHWNGRYKPWQIPSSHSKLWEKWFIADPTGKFQIRKL